MVDQLRVFFEPDSNGTGELFVEVRCGYFSGVSSAWFGEAELLEFGQRLQSTVPLPTGERIELQGGYWDQSGSIEGLHVGLSFYPVGSLGVVGCQVHVATRLSQSERAEQQSRLVTAVLTSYECLREFGCAFVALVRGHANEAVLQARGS